jgi:predicted dehydrogenase
MREGRMFIGVIGCGSMAVEHTACLHALDPRIGFAFCDLDMPRAEEFRARYAGSYATSEPQQVFGDPGVDAVYILTHHDSHAALAVAAARAGKDVFIEKPLAMTAAECRAIGAAVEKAGVLLMPGFKLRFYPTVRIARERVPEPYSLIAQVSDQRWDDAFWANDPVTGGGNVFSQGCHAMDLVAHLAGSEPVRIHAEGGNYHHPGLVIVDGIAATVSFANGAVASVSIADHGSSAVVSKFSFQLMDGSACAHLHNRMKSLTLNAGGSVTVHNDEEETGVLEENRAFLSSLHSRHEPEVTWRDGLRAVAMIEACFESLRLGAPVSVQL